MGGSHKVNFKVVPIRTGFEGERAGQSLRGLHETEIKFADFIETFSSLKSHTFVCSFSYEKREQKNIS
jgi:hypothetical protein